MPIRRFDHRARFRATYLNSVIDQVNLLNKTRFYFQGQQGGNIRLGGSISYDLVYELSDMKFFCPPIPPVHPTEVYNHFWLRREAIPTWGHTMDSARWAKGFAENIAQRAADGEYEDWLELDGWGGFDLTGVSASTYTLGDNYNPPGTQMLPCTEYYPGGEYYWTGGDADYPNGVNWGSKSGDGAIARVYPFDPGAGGGGGNSLSVSPNSASFNASPQAVGFMHLLQSLPPGAVITRAAIPVKLSNFSKWHRTITYTPNYTEPYVEGLQWRGGLYVDSVVDEATETNGSVSFVMFGRRKTGTYVNNLGRTRRRTEWNALGTNIASAVQTDEWSIIDVTDSCNAFLNSYKISDYFSFVLFPTAEGTPLPGSTGVAEWLAGLPQKPSYQIETSPDWDESAGEPTAKNHGHNWGSLNDQNHGNRVRQDMLWTPEEISWNMSWGSLEFGEGVIEWTLPASEGNHTVSSMNIVRGDNPIIV